MLWVPWIVGFGFYPLYVRQPDDLSPIFENVAVFATVFALTQRSPLLSNQGDGNPL
jgi:hypothetical protein